MSLTRVIVRTATAAAGVLVVLALTPIPSRADQVPVVRPLPNGPAIATEHVLLSGPDSATPRQWSVLMSTGPWAGQELPIAVPGQWESLGFGTYAYGHDEVDSSDAGRYRISFEAPQRWSGRQVDIVFEGVMTDTTVFLNGQKVGPTHQGGYTEFRYELTPFVRLGAVNQLDVEVTERSADRSVNLAERKADYWVYGGIYRPVRLEILPERHIRQVSIDAKHDGTMVVEVEVEGLDDDTSSWWIDAELVEGGELLASAPVGPRVGTAFRRTKLNAKAAGVTPWSAETPHLALLEVRLRRGSEVLHTTRERLGFRTIEIAKHGRIGRSQGIWVNGAKVFLRGVNRHDSWPATGRAVATQRARADAELLIALGFNAVRTAHYPPSRAFLDACDELGIYVLDESPGWHDAYSTEVGRLLIAEMVRRDVNHPSVILWANGNEGGWNRTLNQTFTLHDPQRRPVLLPDEIFGDVDTRHYPTWEELTSRLVPAAPWSWLQRLRRRPPLVLPTEMLHGLWDGGGGASLADYVGLLRRSVRGGGFFLWALSDESVVRLDRDRELDSHGNFGPDGIVGPWREWEASAFAVRDTISPVVFHEFDSRGGQVHLDNHLDHTDLGALIPSWRWISLPQAGQVRDHARDLGGSTGRIGVAEPGESSALVVGQPPAEADLLQVSLQRGIDGREIASAALRVRPRPWRGPTVVEDQGVEALVELRGEEWILTSAGTTAAIHHQTGELLRFEQGGVVLKLEGGSRRADGSQGTATAARPSSAAGTARLELDFSSDSPLSLATWRLDARGRLVFVWLGQRLPNAPYDGLRFELPAAVTQIRWVGGGPCPVWRNRLAGARLGSWTQPSQGFGLGCNEVNGFYHDVEWMVLEVEGSLLLVEPAVGLALGVGVPEFPAGSKSAVAEVPPNGALTLLHRLPAIGTKFHPAVELGPQAAEADEEGLFRGSVALSFAGVGEPVTPVTPVPPVPPVDGEAATLLP